MFSILIALLINFILINSNDSASDVYYITSRGEIYFGTQNGIVNNDIIASAKFENKINKTGWSQLEVTTNGQYPDIDQAYYAGFLEGFLTSELIGMMWRNTMEHNCDNEKEFCLKLYNFIETNINFTKNQINKHKDAYWSQVQLSLVQVTGLQDGYNYAMKFIKPLGPRIDINPKGLFLMNIATETYALQNVLKKNKMSLYDEDDHCSALVKILPDGSDLLVAHDTWGDYQAMIRIVKRYNFNYSGISSNAITFTSYPGVIYSVDDWYQLSSGLVVLETTINNFNVSLWKNIVADKIVFEFIRNTVANRLAKSGKEWAQIFAQYNSGTYNNQFMIVDYKKFQRGTLPKELPNDTLWILEQLPGYVQSGDVTHVLREQLYWPSYNIPYFTDVYNISGYNDQCKKIGVYYSYDHAPRANIFRRDHSKVKDLKTLYKLMRYNDFKNDPLSRCNCTPPYSANFAIAARDDLNDPDGKYPIPYYGFRDHGAHDTKVVNYDLFYKNEMIAVCGPTYDQQPPFDWTNTKLKGKRHEGQPNKWTFLPVHVSWTPFGTKDVRFE